MKTIQKFYDDLAAGQYDALLARLACCAPKDAAPQRDRLHHITEEYAKVFGRSLSDEITLCSAPGRTEIGGNHTDHQRGKVLTGSVNLDALICAAPNGTSTVRVYSEGYGMLTVDCSDLSPVESEKNTTASLIRGVYARLAGLGYTVGGYDAYITSGVPGGSGLSSSACFEVLLGVTMNHLYCNDKLSMAAIAIIGQYTENVYFGKPSGLMDQMGCALGGVVAIDFRDREKPVWHQVDFDFFKAGYCMCVVDSGADHADLTDDYAAIPVEMRAVAAACGKEVLSEVDENEFYAKLPAIRAQVGDRAVLRAIHYYMDCAKVDEEVAALESGDFDKFLAVVNASGNSSFKYLQNIATFRDARQQPVAVALAAAEHCLKGRGASRVHGGGFAGTIQAFVPLDMVDEFKANMDALLFKGATKVASIRPVGGCVIVE